ncbi:MAG TPA: hypothetical protein VHK65_07040 [Candidatus Dormibacteraeota bacterium]|nr:hypothetical protein [Candidatus Dormibacteraeota bacterium]
MSRDEFLGRLTGRWEGRGLVGDTVLHQAVESRWVLGDHFVEMRFRELDGRPYEAAYLVGLDDRSARYILILADSTGVYPNPSAVVGIGQKNGDAVIFSFGDPTPSFMNRFEWHEADGSWSHVLTSIEPDGRATIFATKHLTRI